MSKLPAAGWTLTARWILPVSGPSLENGTVTVAGDVIVAVEPHGQRTPDIDLGNAAVIPGLVNAHTHLDLSSVTSPIPFDGDFTNWLRGVIAHRRALEPEQVEAAVRAGLAESLSHGVTLLGDIASGGISWPIVSSAPCRAVVFHELIGLAPERAESAMAAARGWLETIRLTETCRPGLSPHAPYSVSGDLFEQARELADIMKFPFAIHVAETRAEREFIECHSGPFLAFLQELGVWDETAFAASLSDERTPVFWRSATPRTLLSTPTTSRRWNCRARAKPSSTVRARMLTFAIRSIRFRDFLSRGIRVALGTDSRASNPDLDLLAEARFLHQLYPDIPGCTLLSMATLAGAEALGWADVTGSLAPGKSADLVAVSLPNRDEADPYHLLFDSQLPGRRVLWRGQWR